MKVYLDLVLLLNFAVNLCLLRATACLTGARFLGIRLSLGAALGAAYAAACLLPGVAFLGNNLWRLVFLILMCACAFGLNRGFLRKTGVLLLLSFALGGAAACLRLCSFWGLLLLGGAMALACRLFLKGSLHHAGQLVPVSLTLGDRSLHLSALRDSGNTLQDPFTGQPVLVVQGSEAEGLLGKLDLRDPAGAMAALRKSRPEVTSRLIPYRALGGPGLLLAVKCDEVRIAGKKQGRFVAFSPDSLTGTGEYQALTGGGTYA